MKQRIVFDILGGFNNNASGVKRGDIVELDDDVADRCRHLGYCQDVDVAQQSPDQRKERADQAKQAFEAYAKRPNGQIERQRQDSHRTIDCRTGKPLASKR